MSYNCGYYSIKNENDSIMIQFPNEKADEKENRKFKIILFTAWAIVSMGITLFFLFTQYYAHAVLFFLILGVGGLYICLNIVKREEMKYFSVLINTEGVHEIWNYPNKPIKKTLKWDDLKYFDLLSKVTIVAGKPSLPYACILFSCDEKEESDRRKQIRKVWSSSMQYEIKFRDIPNNIFLMIDDREGDAFYKFILDYMHHHNIKI